MLACRLSLLLVLLTLLVACAPKVGSEAWCKAMDAKAKGDWTANDFADYTKHCVLKIKPAE